MKMWYNKEEKYSNYQKIMIAVKVLRWKEKFPVR
jgi:hypothetical protein